MPYSPIAVNSYTHSMARVHYITTIVNLYMHHVTNAIVVYMFVSLFIISHSACACIVCGEE